MLRTTLMDTNRITCLFSGSSENILRDQLTSEPDTFQKNGRLASLSPIAPEAWREGLAARAAEDNRELTDQGLARILELTGGHPWATMLVAQRTHEAAIASDDTILDPALVEDSWQSAVAANTATAMTTVEHIDTLAAHALTAAKAIAAGQSPYKHLRSQQARRALDALVSASVIDETGRGRWAVNDPILRAHLQRLTLF